MRLVALLLALHAGCSATAANNRLEATTVDLSAAPDAAATEPPKTVVDASTADAETEEPSAPEGPTEIPGRATLTAREIKLAERIHFKTDQPVILDDSFPLLDAVATLLLSHPKVTIEIQCHSDNRGSNDHNLELTKNRANAIWDYLASKGVPPARMTAQGYGASRPITDIAPQLLRRCEFIRTDVR